MLKINTWNTLTVYLNWIIGDTEQYNKPFDCEQMDELCWIE